jgi:TfoX/Sxy family transcriptional regulator of competence genes
MAKSLRSSDTFKQFVLDQLEPLDVTPKSMFGGTGLYARGLFFGIVAMDKLYLKVGDRNRRMFEREGMKAFKPYAHRPASKKYYEVPLSVLESAPELERWARQSIEVAEKAGRAPQAAKRTRAARSSSKATRAPSMGRAARGRTRR